MLMVACWTVSLPKILYLVFLSLLSLAAFFFLSFSSSYSSLPCSPLSRFRAATWMVNREKHPDAHTEQGGTHTHPLYRKTQDGYGLFFSSSSPLSLWPSFALSLLSRFSCVRALSFRPLSSSFTLSLLRSLARFLSCPHSSSRPLISSFAPLLFRSFQFIRQPSHARDVP